MASQQEITKKINDLFTYRRIPYMLKLAGIPKDSPFVKQLMDLQQAIYALDEYLEANWQVKKSALDKHWKEINRQLRAFGLNRYQVVAFRKDIERYQSYELEMRDGRMPTRRPFKTTYGAKTCDVRLIRKLIYHEAPDLSKRIRETDWRPYDLITEVNDDINDVYEDLSKYNGNRFLISLLTRGKGRTRSEFSAFLRDTGKDARLRFKKRSGKENDELAAWTARRLDQTRVLLKKRLGQPKLSTTKTALIKGVIPKAQLLR
ncbi:MAG: hypothetical protein R3301_04155 [Saprospiraceae bacterium]|nr:hypothetical protein [Saprospiraceae bacterium]